MKDDSNIVSSVLGFAVGDAIGVPIEFQSRKILEQNPLTDMIGYGSHNMPAGTWSDDTSMVLATISSLIDCGGICYDDIMKNFLLWYKEAMYTATDSLFDIGFTTQKALCNYSHGISALKCGLTDYHSNGNGSLMRILPIAFWLYENKLSREEEVQIVNNISSLTHGHELSQLGCLIYCDYIKNLCDGVSKEKAYQLIKSNNYLKFYNKDVVNAHCRILTNDISLLCKEEINSSGFIVDSLEASIWATLTSDSYEHAIIKAINLGKDTDTIGAITGGLNGIIYGLENIPERWLSKLKKRDYIFELANMYNATLKKHLFK